MKLLIYETTHHENLPALLDLATDRCEQVAVFLRRLSYENISGQGDPAQLWPGVQFVLQEEEGSNRDFIRRLFAFMRENGYTHLHLATLDNNLLFFAWMIRGIRDVHISLTVHEVHEYNANRYRDLRDWSETLAKRYLRRRIRHYHFFLPAMVELFRQKDPRSTAVWIPSRFYTIRREQGVGSGDRPVAGSGDSFRIVIPGSVEDNRRDYGFVVAFMKELLARREASGAMLELVLLGNGNNPYGLKIIEALKNLGSASFQLTCYTELIPQDEYERQLAGATILWSPLRLEKVSLRKVPEVAGISTASGLTADILLNNIPALVPYGYTIPEAFRAALLPYRSKEDLAELLIRCIHDPAWYAECRRTIAGSFAYFTKENFREAFETLMGGKAPEDR